MRASPRPHRLEALPVFELSLAGDGAQLENLYSCQLDYTRSGSVGIHDPLALAGHGKWGLVFSPIAQQRGSCRPRASRHPTDEPVARRIWVAELET